MTTRPPQHHKLNKMTFVVFDFLDIEKESPCLVTKKVHTSPIWSSIDF